MAVAVAESHADGLTETQVMVSLLRISARLDAALRQLEATPVTLAVGHGKGQAVKPGLKPVKRLA